MYDFPSVVVTPLCMPRFDGIELFETTFVWLCCSSRTRGSYAGIFSDSSFFAHHLVSSLGKLGDAARVHSLRHGFPISVRVALTEPDIFNPDAPEERAKSAKGVWSLKARKRPEDSGLCVFVCLYF